ncbi:MAG: PepSY domain-containing protein [Allorhizobium sp.]
MRKIILAAALVSAAFASTALAEGKHDCGNTPSDKWIGEQAMKDKAGEMGLTVRQVKVEDGCYEVYGIDAKGNKVEELFNPGTGEQVGND